MTMASSSKSNKRNSIRSISFPCRLHPSTSQIEEELNKFKTWEAEATSVPTAETIYNGLSVLEELYKCTDDLLNLPLNRRALSHHQHEEWINELLDGSVKLLDICGSMRDIMSQIKVQERELQSALRRRQGDLSTESSLPKYTSFIRKIKKDAKRLISALKQVNSKSHGLQSFDLDHNLTIVIGVLKEVTMASISVFQSASLFLSTSVLKPKVTKWSLVSRLMHKGKVACEAQQHNANELDRVDAVISIYGSSAGQNMVIAQERLEALEVGVVGIENGLEHMFRCLIRTRASLLNIVYQ